MRATVLPIGIALCVLGVVGWLGAGRTSVTALIPAFFGLPIAVCGVLVRRGSRPAMWTAVVLAVLGAGGAARGLAGIPRLLAGEAERPLAVVSQTVMVVLCVLLLAAAAARRGRLD